MIYVSICIARTKTALWSCQGQVWPTLTRTKWEKLLLEPMVACGLAAAHLVPWELLWGGLASWHPASVGVHIKLHRDPPGQCLIDGGSSAMYNSSKGHSVLNSPGTLAFQGRCTMALAFPIQGSLLSSPFTVSGLHQDLRLLSPSLAPSSLIPPSHFLWKIFCTPHSTLLSASWRVELTEIRWGIFSLK